MPEGDKNSLNALIQAFVAAARRERYSKVMEGIGHVAVAVAYAEFILDGIGAALTGALEPYLTLTKGMSLGSKADRVRVMSESLIKDKNLRDIAIKFCSDLKNILDRRNDIVHSLYGLVQDDVVRIDIRVRRRAVVTSAELFELAAQIHKLATESASLPEQLERQGRRLA